MKKKQLDVTKKLPYLFVYMLAAIAVLFLLPLFANQKQKIKYDLKNIREFKMPYQSLRQLQVFAADEKIDFHEAVTLYFFYENFFPAKVVPLTSEQLDRQFISQYKQIKNSYNKNQLEQFKALLGSVLDDIKSFPIPQKEDGATYSYMYGDSYGSERIYGGKRIHEGTDIFDRENVRGTVPIVSMTDGVVENLGWNEKGGWRVGIRSNGGHYFYYAHLYAYEESLTEGMRITAGQKLGMMGDSGYSKKPGTVANFPVHLHIGICLNQDIAKEEIWLNPYSFLRFIEGQ